MKPFPNLRNLCPSNAGSARILARC